jgi:aryl-alcohol dehydrogenase-like predicted oxidoreductase
MSTKDSQRIASSKSLGNAGPSVSPLGLGAMALTGVYGSIDRSRADATLRRAIELGVTMIDTSPSYAAGRNEEVVGAVIRGHREGIFLSSKFGSVFAADGTPGHDGRPEWARQSVEASLTRLGTDHLDLLYLHRVDPAVPIEESVGGMAELVKEGKVRHIGLSEAGPKTIRRAHAVHPLTALQSEYSLWTREVEERILPTLDELGIGLVAFSPLGRGFLTGQIKSIDDLPEDDWRRTAPRFQGENFERNLVLVREIERLAERRGATPAQLALAWLMERLPHGVPLFGADSPTIIESNLGALEIRLTPEEIDEIERAAPPGVAHGERFPEAFARKLNTD